MSQSQDLSRYLARARTRWAPEPVPDWPVDGRVERIEQPAPLEAAAGDVLELTEAVSVALFRIEEHKRDMRFALGILRSLRQKISGFILECQVEMAIERLEDALGEHQGDCDECDGPCRGEPCVICGEIHCRAAHDGRESTVHVGLYARGHW